MSKLRPPGLFSRCSKLFILACATVSLTIQVNCQNNTGDSFDWYSLTPSTNITWTPCFDTFKCARLSLPLDYSTPNGPTTEIALLMKPATDMENYLGTILVNPGGPGGSGTQFVQSVGTELSAIVGPQFDFLGFDPRGTGATTPLAQCFDSDSQFQVWNLQNNDFLNKSDGSIPLASSKLRLIGERCQAALGGNGKEDLNGNATEWGSGRFMDTASVATDMLNIVQKLGQEKLQYAGISYGSVIGQYFAAMYPDKVGRMLIDGVLDAMTYREVQFASLLDDTDAVISSFYTFCHQAGDKCPLFESTVDAIQARVSRILESVASAPVPVPFAGGPAVITKNDLEDAFLGAIYTPVSLYPGLADIFVGIENNNQSVLANFVDSSVSYQCQSQEPSPWLRQNEAATAIWCSDGDPVHDTPAEFDAFLDKLSGVSATAAPVFARNRLRCREWSIQAKNRYTGPVSANTSFPLLLTAAAFDPVCPINNAETVLPRFNGSVLLKQNSYGHCAFSNPSTCLVEAARAYFTQGVLPKNGTVCEVDNFPWINSTDSTGIGGQNTRRSLEDEELLEHVKSFTSKLSQWRSSLQSSSLIKTFKNEGLSLKV